MGAGASVKRSHSSLKAEIERLRERELNAKHKDIEFEENSEYRSAEKEEGIKEWDIQEINKDRRIANLKSERDELAQTITEMQVTMSNLEEEWQREKKKAIYLTYCNLPLALISEQDQNNTQIPVTKAYPMVTILQCDMVGFSLLAAGLKPQEVIIIIDHLHTLMEEIFHHNDIQLAKINSDGCTAISGLDEHVHQKYRGSLSATESSSGSEPESDHDIYTGKSGNSQQFAKNAAYYANILATSALNLMSASSKIHVPLKGRKQLQLRMALHSGPCSAGVLGLQVDVESNCNPAEFKIMGPTIQHVKILCRTGLALQIRVSKESRMLLGDNGEYVFERCPDFIACVNQKPIESYWLVGQTSLSIKLPSLDLAIPLSHYDEIDI